MFAQNNNLVSLLQWKCWTLKRGRELVVHCVVHAKPTRKILNKKLGNFSPAGNFSLYTRACVFSQNTARARSYHYLLEMNTAHVSFLFWARSYKYIDSQNGAKKMTLHWTAFHLRVCHPIQPFVLLIISSWRCPGVWNSSFEMGRHWAARWVGHWLWRGKAEENLDVQQRAVM